MKSLDKPLVSVIVNCFNSEEFILECINSVLNQSYSNFECHIINDGSTDDSEKIILDNKTMALLIFITLVEFIL